jgi:hypothetical protein
MAIFNSKPLNYQRVNHLSRVFHHPKIIVYFRHFYHGNDVESQVFSAGISHIFKQVTVGWGQRIDKLQVFEFVGASLSMGIPGS